MYNFKENVLCLTLVGAMLRGVPSPRAQLHMSMALT